MNGCQTFQILHRMGYVFFILVGLMVIISLIQPMKEKKENEGIEVETSMFAVDKNSECVRCW